MQCQEWVAQEAQDLAQEAQDLVQEARDLVQEAQDLVQEAQDLAQVVQVSDQDARQALHQVHSWVLDANREKAITGAFSPCFLFFIYYMICCSCPNGLSI
jgi:ABC-type transporter Mla subunit MlaD